MDSTKPPIKREDGSPQISDSFAKRLILEVYNRPILYDSKHRHFADSNRKEQFWHEVAYELQAEVDFCKSMWSKLPQKYSNCLEKVRRNYLKQESASITSQLLYLTCFIEDLNEMEAELEKEKRRQLLAAKRAQYQQRAIPAHQSADKKPIWAVPTSKLLAKATSSADDSLAKTSSGDEDEQPAEQMDIDVESLHSFCVTKTMCKMLARIKKSPMLYDSNSKWYVEYWRKSARWNWIAADMGEKATRLMKCWIIMCTRYEWELATFKRKYSSDLQRKMAYFLHYIETSHDSVYKQSFYLKQDWQEPIESFRNLGRLMNCLKQLPEVVLLTDELLHKPEKSERFCILWNEVAKSMSYSAGQCETTWLIMRRFYVELTNIRKVEYRLSDVWYFEKVIAEVYALARAYKAKVKGANIIAPNSAKLNVPKATIANMEHSPGPKIASVKSLAHEADATPKRQHNKDMQSLDTRPLPVKRKKHLSEILDTELPINVPVRLNALNPNSQCRATLNTQTATKDSDNSMTRIIVKATTDLKPNSCAAVRPIALICSQVVGSSSAGSQTKAAISTMAREALMEPETHPSVKPTIASRIHSSAKPIAVYPHQTPVKPTGSHSSVTPTLTFISHPSVKPTVLYKSHSSVKRTAASETRPPVKTSRSNLSFATPVATKTHASITSPVTPTTAKFTTHSPGKSTAASRTHSPGKLTIGSGLRPSAKSPVVSRIHPAAKLTAASGSDSSRNFTIASKIYRSVKQTVSFKAAPPTKREKMDKIKSIKSTNTLERIKPAKSGAAVKLKTASKIKSSALERGSKVSARTSSFAAGHMKQRIAQLGDDPTDEETHNTSTDNCLRIPGCRKRRVKYFPQKSLNESTSTGGQSNSPGHSSLSPTYARPVKMLKPNAAQASAMVSSDSNLKTCSPIKAQGKCLTPMKVEIKAVVNPNHSAFNPPKAVDSNSKDAISSNAAAVVIQIMPLGSSPKSEASHHAEEALVPTQTIAIYRKEDMPPKPRRKLNTLPPIPYIQPEKEFFPPAIVSASKYVPASSETFSNSSQFGAIGPMLNDNEVLIELISSDDRKYLLISGPSLTDEYELPIPTVIEFIRSIMAIPLLHKTDFKQPILIKNYWSHISQEFLMPLSLCQLCWKFLLENFEDLAQIAPLHELMRPFSSKLQVWTNSPHLFLNFNEQAVHRGWRAHIDLLPDLFEAIGNYPVLFKDVGENLKNFSSNLDEQATLQLLSVRFPTIDDISDIWSSFKTVFCQYMRDLEIGINHQWHTQWWRALGSLRFLVRARYTRRDPYFYIVFNKMDEELERCSHLVNEMQLKKLRPLMKWDEDDRLASSCNGKVELAALMMAIEQHPIIYQKGDTAEKFQAWQNVAKQLERNVLDCLRSFQRACHNYCLFTRMDNCNFSHLNRQYYKRFEAIFRSVLNMRDRKEDIRLNTTPVAYRRPLSQKIHNCVFPERYVSDICMTHCSSTLVVKNWIYALTNMSKATQDSIEKTLKDIIAKYSKQDKEDDDDPSESYEVTTN